MGWATCFQTSPTMQLPHQVDCSPTHTHTHTHTGAGGVLFVCALESPPAQRRAHTSAAAERSGRTPQALLSSSSSWSSLSASASSSVGHVPLWNRLPALQVDRPPAAALRHHLRHHRHRRHVGLGGGRGRQVALRQHVGAVPRQERQLGLQVAHGVPLGPGCCRPDDHRPHHPRHRLHHLLRGSVLHPQPVPDAPHRRDAHPRRGPPVQRSHHLPSQVQRADLRGLLLLHLGVRLRLGRHHPLHRLRHPLLLPAALRGRADRPGQDQIPLLLRLKTLKKRKKHRSGTLNSKKKVCVCVCGPAVKLSGGHWRSHQ